jgi:hypothetical protein
MAWLLSAVHIQIVHTAVLAGQAVCFDYAQPVAGVHGGRAVDQHQKYYVSTGVSTEKPGAGSIARLRRKHACFFRGAGCQAC